MSLWQKIKAAFSCCPGDDTGSYPTGQCSYNGKQARFTRLLPYGLSSLEPENYFVFVVNSQGQEAVKFGIPSAMQDRLKSMKQGEVAIYNSITKTFFHLRENGSFLVNCSGKIEGDVEITGNLDVGGNVAVAGNLTAQTITCDEIIVNGVPSSTHVHGGVSTGSGTTAGPQ